MNSSFLKEGKPGGVHLGVKKINSVSNHVDFDVYVGQQGRNIKETV